MGAVGGLVVALVARTWNGMSITDRVHRAGGRAIIGIGVAVATETKRITHVISGTLRRSITVSPHGTVHDSDEATALPESQGGLEADLLLSGESIEATPTLLGPSVEVGSWLPYACVEWVGRNHPGITQGLEMVRGARADAIVAQAWREERLV